MEQTNYALNLEAAAKQKFTVDKQSIGNALNGFKIKNILHFTHITNLVSILTYGLKSVYDLNKQNILHHRTDSERYDQIYQGICCSLAYPNIWMLNRKLGLEIKNYVILELMENTLMLQHFAAFPGNAATGFLRADASTNPEKYVGIEGLRRMFLNKPLRKSEAIPTHVPTDLQSELIFFNTITTDRIRSIHFPGPKIDSFSEIYNQVFRDFGHLGIEFECKHNYFYKQDLKTKFDGRQFKLSWETI